MKPKEKKCKGAGITIGYGCGKPSLFRKWGLCNECLRDWYMNTPEGKEKMSKAVKKVSAPRLSLEKAIKENKTPNRKLDLQKEVNLLARKIDKHFNYKCIDCDKVFGKQTDAAHLHNVQGNENIRYNLHNLHSARSHCNKYSSEHKVGYRKGIIKRYGERYLDYIEFEIPQSYNYIGLLDNEVAEKLKIVRKLNREFDTFVLIDGRQARDLFNKIIGIYK